MEVRNTRYGALFSATVAMLFMFVLSVHAADELYLTGIVKSTVHNTRTVVVDVQSSSCHGPREFTVDEPYGLDDFVDKKIDFSIDSSTCESGKVYKMFPGGRKWR